MATVVIRQPAQGIPTPGTPAPHRKVTIASKIGTITLPITSPEVDHEDLAPVWATIPRPGRYRKPLLKAAGVRLRRFRLEVTILPGQFSVATTILLLRSAASVGACTVAYSTLEAGQWNITELSAKTTRRQQGTNEPIEATATIELTEAGDEPPRPSVIKTATGGSPATVPTAPVQSAPAGPRRYTVRKGDTLWGIAQRYYGNGARWTTIASANGIKNPRLLQVGHVLTIP